MNHAARNRIEGAEDVRRHVPYRLAFGKSPRGPRPFDNVRGYVVEGARSELAHVQVVVGVEVVDLDEADVVHLGDLRFCHFVCRFVQLHVARLGHRAGTLSGLGNRGELLARVADGLLDEDMLPGVKGGHGDLRLGVVVTHQDGVDIRIEHGAVVGKAVRHVEQPRGVVDGGRRHIADGGDLELLRQLGEEGQVLDLRDRAAPDDANAYGVHCASHVLPARGAMSFHRSASSVERR